MLPTTNLDILRRMRNGPADGLPDEVRAYVRTEYNGDAATVLAEIAQAGRVGSAKPTPTSARAKGRGFARFFASLAARFARPEESP